MLDLNIFSLNIPAVLLVVVLVVVKIHGQTDDVPRAPTMAFTIDFFHSNAAARAKQQVKQELKITLNFLPKSQLDQVRLFVEQDTGLMIWTSWKLVQEPKTFVLRKQAGDFGSLLNPLNRLFFFEKTVNKNKKTAE